MQPPQQPEGYGGEGGDANCERLLKPLPYGDNKDLRQLAETITRDIFVSDPNVSDVI